MIWQSLTNSNGFAALSFCQPVTTNAAKCKVTTTLVTKASTSTQHQQNLKNVGIKFQQYLYLNQVYLICHLILKPTKTPVPDTHPHHSYSPDSPEQIATLWRYLWCSADPGSSNDGLATQKHGSKCPPGLLTTSNRESGILNTASGRERIEGMKCALPRAPTQAGSPPMGDHAKARPEIWATWRGRW